MKRKKIFLAIICIITGIIFIAPNGNLLGDFIGVLLIGYGAKIFIDNRYPVNGDGK